MAVKDADVIWANDYISIPFVVHGRDETGLDCWGLVRLVLAEQCGIVVPSLVEVYDDVDEHEKISRKVLQESMNASRWIQVIKGQEQPFDVMICNMAGNPMHIAIITKPGKILHIVEGGMVQHIDYTKGAWKQPKKIVGIYRHKDLCSMT